MGLFSPSDEKFIAKVAPRFSEQVAQVRQIGWDEGVGLSYHERREVQFVMTSVWVDVQLRRHSISMFAPNASQLMLASLKDQARRIGQNFSEPQRLVFEEALRSLEDSGILDPA